ncbi:hypothetical protein [Paraclostridium dentum]|uniref:hypothetical protein n=1 Tax=Paraclostridium dentum TaxID=2662455 RepID=UPI00051D3EE1|nr:hypothetical protein [Paraclostridium dentum]KGJ49705.1 hypothetical protein KD33_07025 [Clostridium sp. NCR]
MRFDKSVDIFVREKIEDGQGGFIERDIYDSTVKANVIEMPLEFVYKIYGSTMVSMIKVVLHSKHKRLSKIRYNDKLYRIIRINVQGNKTFLTLEEDNG